MTDLYEEIARKCSYEIGKAREAVSRLPADAPDKDKADAVRDAFISNGGGVGWGVVGRDQVEIDARGAWLYRLINGTSGDTQTVEFIGWVQLLHMLDKRDIFTETSAGQIKFRI